MPSRAFFKAVRCPFFHEIVIEWQNSQLADRLAELRLDGVPSSWSKEVATRHTNICHVAYMLRLAPELQFGQSSSRAPSVPPPSQSRPAFPLPAPPVLALPNFALTEAPNPLPAGEWAAWTFTWILELSWRPLIFIAERRAARKARIISTRPSPLLDGPRPTPHGSRGHCWSCPREFRRRSAASDAAARSLSATATWSC
jgi:hypothetical protein